MGTRAPRSGQWLRQCAAAAILCACQAAAHATTPLAQRKHFQISLSFQESRANGAVRYIWRGSGAAVSLDPGGNVRILQKDGSEAHLSFAGARHDSEPRGEIQSSVSTIYYTGPQQSWHTHPHFERVRYPAIYPGMDLVFVTTGERLEYNFELAPHANPNLIRVHFEGYALDLTPEGDLELRSARSLLAQRRPSAFQENSHGRNVSVPCRYRLADAYDATLQLGTYDTLRPLLIDPVIDFSTYLGGSSYDSVNAATTDAHGNLYVTGETSSGSLTNSSTQPRSSRDAFVARFNSAGSLIMVVYVGGSQYDSGRGIALDPLGNVYITGVTESSDFPVTSGAFQTRAAGTQSAFVVKLNGNLGLQYATYLGGGISDSGLAIAVDSTGAAYVAGQTASPAFPVTQGAFQTTYHGGMSDCFVSKLNAAGSALTYSTFLGGSGLDSCAGIALDGSANAYVVGTTYSYDFPVAGPLQSALLGTATGFVTKLNAAGSALVYSTYLGGSSLDNATAVAVDSSGEAYVTGNTASFDFPTTAGVVQTALNGLYNVFASKLSAAGNALVYSTFLGGSGSDAGTSIAIDSAGRTVVGGYTTSSNFPTAGAIQASFQGAFDAFAAILAPGGTSLVFSSYFGGSGDDRAYALALAPNGIFYLAGITSSSNFPLASANQSALSVAPDAFVMEVSYIGGEPQAVSVTPNSGSGTSQTFQVQFSDTAGASNLQQVYVFFSATLSSETNSCVMYYNPAANQLNLLNNNVSAWSTAVPGAQTALQNSQCSINMATSSASLSGNTLTLSIAMTFAQTYSGAKNVYLWGSDVSGANSGWQQLGTWTVPATDIPATVSVTPSSGSGTSQTFALVYSDAAGASNLQQLYVLIGASLATESNSCTMYYNQPANQFNLLNDSASAWLTGTPGTSTTLQNSQCSVSMAGSSVALNGTTLTLSVATTFSPAYAGAKNIYLWASNVSGANTGWRQLATWTVPAASGPVAVSVTPSSGSGATQAFAMAYSDPSGAASLRQLYVLIGSSLASETNSCVIFYNPAANQINLLNNSVSAWLTATPGSATTLQNSQCAVNMAASSVASSGITMTLSLAMSFTSAYAGAKNVYLWASDSSGANTGWRQLGTWTVPGTSAPSAVSVTPNSGSAMSQTFAMLYSDTAGAASLQQLYVLIGSSLASEASSCVMFYNPAANQINLLNDNVTAWLTGTPGATTTLQNSQCAVSLSGTTVTRSGNNLTLNLAMSFTAPYAGTKNVYLWASDSSGANTGWRQLGTWTVP